MAEEDEELSPEEVEGGLKDAEEDIKAGRVRFSMKFCRSHRHEGDNHRTCC